MVVLSEREVRELKVGDKVNYIQHMGEHSGRVFKATVKEIYPYHIELECLANEELERYFYTSFCFRDCCSKSHQRLTRDTIEDYEFDDEIDDGFDDEDME